MISLRCLCHLVLRAFWPKIFAYCPSLQTLQCDHEHANPSSHTEEATVNKESLELPVDILTDIFALLEIPDLVRASCVCSSWHTAYTSLRSSGWYNRQQTPCLLYTSEFAGNNIACMYSLAEKRVYKLNLPGPPIHRRNIIGSSNGWLVTADEMSELHIVNPITREQIALPSVTTIEQVKPIFDESGALQEYELSHYFGEGEIDDPNTHAPNKLRDSLYVKAFVFFDSSRGSYIVVLIHNPIDQLSFAWLGDSKWTWLPPSAQYEDCIYMDGLLYVISSAGGIDVFDFTGPAVLRKVIIDDMKNYIYERMYLVQLPSGDLLQVWRDQDVILVEDVADEERDPSGIKWETTKMMLYKVDMEAKKLVQINSLHGHVLFLGYGQSHCVTTEEYPQLKANHVYLTDDQRSIALFWKSNHRDIGIFNLGNNITEEIVPSQCWCAWPAPIWITPSLTKLSSALKK